MNIWRLVGDEILYRKTDFLLGVAAVFLAVGCLAGVSTLLRAHSERVAELTGQKQKETAGMLAVARDDYRKMMKTMGYNVVILNAGEDLTEFWTNGFASKTMPEELVSRLCNSNITSIQHLLPQLYQKILWAEQDNCPVILIGVRGEVLHQQSNHKEPMLDPVEKDTMRLGHALARKLGLKSGEKVTLLGTPFTIAQVHEERGNADDGSVWIHMAQAQVLLKKPGQINAILALSCLCAEGDLNKISRQIAAILPETQVIHRVPEALIRLDARYRVAALSQETIEKETAYHVRAAAERETLAAWMIPLAILAAMLWIGMLAWNNVRERRSELGVLRALGFRARHIAALILAKALLAGVAGALAGYALGFVAGLAWSIMDGIPLSIAAMRSLFDVRLLVIVLAAAPLQACISSWLPAMIAAQQDPAEILREG
ncbi:MAG TPA: FtsX-like permease family protein [Candidatus Hydrogenedentes bacterium]|nr:FtsX-like permease family protein [Candidatus Hydrogenedentota bacterium]